jgi:2-phosphosulfolactate phosphatase
LGCGRSFGHGTGADVVVVVDVFSFCTCVEVAAGRGATVVPWAANHRFAAEWADRHGAVLAAADRAADRPSLSPCSLTELAPGTQLVLPSPNEALASQRAASTAALVFAGCLRNAGAVAAAAASVATGPILVVAAGERWPDGALRPALEDLAGAGSILARLPGSLSPEAAAAVAVSRDAGVAASLVRCESAQELVERGFSDDVECALDAESSETVPVIRHPDRHFTAF